MRTQLRLLAHSSHKARRSALTRLSTRTSTRVFVFLCVTSPFRYLPIALLIALSYLWAVPARHFSFTIHTQDNRRAMSDNATMPDAELLLCIAAGDVKAFAVFYDRYSTLLLSIAARVLSDMHEAEEVLQDAARSVWENAPIYNPTLGKPVSWAVVITRNKALDRLRILQRKSQAIAALTAEADANFAASRHGSSSDVLTRETDHILHGALASLPNEQRLAIELAFFTGLTQTEVASHLQQPLGTIKARIRRGMLTLRDVLEEQI